MTPTHPTEATIELQGVYKHYGPVRAVDGVDLRVAPGELFGLIGHNGAGKSTLFKMMLGLIAPTAGEIRVAGASVQGRAFRAARRRIGYLPENLVLYDNLSGLETLQFFARLKGIRGDALTDCRPLLARVGLNDAMHRPVREYSKGMRQRLGFAQALLGTPRVLFLDEPTTGLDPEAIRAFYEILDTLRGQGVTILITSHILAELQQRVDRLAILEQGRVQALGSVGALREQIDLPLTIALRVAPGAAASLQTRLARWPDLQIRMEEGGDVLVVRCARALKTAVLTAALSLDDGVRDVHIREPSLEEIFFEWRA